MTALVQQTQLIPDSWATPVGEARDDGTISHGEVFTRAWVVELILDLAGYTPDRDLAVMRAIEPACGTGAFLVPMVLRLAESCKRHGRSIQEARDAIHGVDLLKENITVAQVAVAKALELDGWSKSAIRRLVYRWLRVDDFLLGTNLTGSAEFVLGNPPYVRIEDMSDARSNAYRRACTTMGGRADLFVGFYEVGLRALLPGGTLAYICADRWMHNAYGRSLRGFVSENFAVDAAIIMHDVDAFEEEVSAYPAITIIRRKEQGPAVLANTTAKFGQREAGELLRWTQGRQNRPKHTKAFEVAKLAQWHPGQDAWPAGNPDRLALIADLEDRFPRLEDHETGTRVGIGVATGADGVFVTVNSDVVEAERLLPLSMVRDTKTGHFEWSGHYLVDPWADAPGKDLVDLEEYPRLQAYFEERKEQLCKRNVAKRRHRDWFRTIDRVDHDLTAKPKLLFPDMKMAMEPVYEGGGYYPHHNVYYVVSDEWPLDALGGLLLSRVADLFVRTYSVKMRGGTLRFQAQYMRRICVPRLDAIRKVDRIALAKAFAARDVEKATGVALKVYGLPPSTLSVIS